MPNHGDLIAFCPDASLCLGSQPGSYRRTPLSSLCLSLSLPIHSCPSTQCDLLALTLHYLSVLHFLADPVLALPCSAWQEVWLHLHFPGPCAAVSAWVQPIGRDAKRWEAEKGKTRIFFFLLSVSKSVPNSSTFCLLCVFSIPREVHPGFSSCQVTPGDPSPLLLVVPPSLFVFPTKE